MQSAPRIILGMVSLIFGSVIILWALYNVFIFKDPSYSGPDSPLALLIGGFGLAGLLFKYGWHSLMILLGRRENKPFEL